MSDYIKRDDVIHALLSPSITTDAVAIMNIAAALNRIPVEDVRENVHGEWISVEERLPEDNEAVNVVWVNRHPVIYYQDIKDKPQSATGVYYKGQWYWWSAVVQDYLAEYGEWDCDKMDDAIEVTYWMPLPEPPKEGKQ